MTRRSTTAPAGINIQHARSALALVLGTITILAIALNVARPAPGYGQRATFTGAHTSVAPSSATPTSSPEIGDPVEAIVGKRFCERQAAHTTASQVLSLPTGLSLRAVKAVLGAPASARGNVSTYCATTPAGTTVAIRFIVDAQHRVTSII